MLTWILSLCARQSVVEDHYSATFQSRSRADRPRSSPDIRKTVNDTPYYIVHFYTVCQAFALVNVGGPLPVAELGPVGMAVKVIWKEKKKKKKKKKRNLVVVVILSVRRLVGLFVCLDLLVRFGLDTIWELNGGARQKYVKITDSLRVDRKPVYVYAVFSIVYAFFFFFFFFFLKKKGIKSRGIQFIRPCF